MSQTIPGPAPGAPSAPAPNGMSWAPGAPDAQAAPAHRSPAVTALAIVGIVLSVVIAAWAFLTMYTVNRYDAATRQLQTDITTFTADDSADLDALLAQQHSVDAQFADVLTWKWSQLPFLRSDMERNAQVSKDLTEAIEKQQQTNANSSNGSSNDSDSGSDGSSSDSPSGDSSQSGPGTASNDSSDSASPSSTDGQTSDSSQSPSASDSMSSDSSQAPDSSSSSSDAGDGDDEKLQQLRNRNSGGSSNPSGSSPAGGTGGPTVSRPW
ncbi:DUF6466 family protein [Pseudoscardovia radai]|uniref:DUF6466 family protein n=1 Tax=Pseudoscardovia radai TaxID=987066 RepID=UPI003995819B